MSIDNLIKETRKYMSKTEPLKLEYDYLPKTTVSDSEPLGREYFRYGPNDHMEHDHHVRATKKIKPHKKEPLAYCPGCKNYRPMQWKPEKLRGKTVDSWFVCAVCGCGDLEIKRLPQAEAVEKNKLNSDTADTR